MDVLLQDLVQLAATAAARGLPVVVVGALAVRAWLTDPEKRLTRDLDLVVTEEGFPALRQLLVELGFRVYEIGPWWRCERGERDDRRVIDIAIGEVVDMRSFESWPVTPAAAREVAAAGGPPLRVPGLEEVLAMKLLSHRDKDLLDVLLLLREATRAPDAARFRRAVEDRDLEIAIRRGAGSFAVAASSGWLGRLWEERHGAALPSGAVADAVRRLQDLVG